MCSLNFAFIDARRVAGVEVLVYWEVSVGLKYVHTSRIECLLNLSSLYTYTCIQECYFSI